MILTVFIKHDKIYCTILSFLFESIDCIAYVAMDLRLSED